MAKTLYDICSVQALHAGARHHEPCRARWLPGHRLAFVAGQTMVLEDPAFYTANYRNFEHIMWGHGTGAERGQLRAGADWEYMDLQDVLRGYQKATK